MIDKCCCQHSLEVRCVACHYFVFKDKDEAFFEICPVCGWQNEGKKEGEYSRCNHSTLEDYRNRESFKETCLQGVKSYRK